MLVEKVTVIGLGSLGSYFCENLCKTENIKKLTIIDYDIVQRKNLSLSPYKKEDIGKPKVEALERLIRERNGEVKIVKFNEKFKEEITKLPKSDLVVDCRDFTYDRKSLIDTRLSISSRYLLVDCRKDITYRSGYTGLYPLDLQRKDIIDAAEFAASLVRKGLIEKMIEERKVYAIDLDYLETAINSKFGRLFKRNDILFDASSLEVERFTNILECIEPIIRMNKLSRVTVCVGNKKFPEIKKTFQTGHLKTFEDVASSLLSMVAPLDYKSYVIMVNGRHNSVELLAEQAVA